MKATHLKYYIIAAVVALAFVSCTKVIDLKLGNNTGQLVIEGNLTDQAEPQVVRLTRNVPFSDPNTYPAVTGAKVIISSNENGQFGLTEVQPGVYTNTFNEGFSGGTYTLTVTTGGTTYKATSTMPQLVQLDSITASNSQFTSSDKEKGITVYFQDPENLVNQYRFVMYVNGVQVRNVFAFNDDFTNGRYVTIQLLQNDIKVFTGDTVKVEMQCIDKPVYTYFFALSQQEGNNPGGAVAPSNPPTNITPTTLGYFSAHTTQSLTLVVR